MTGTIDIDSHVEAELVSEISGSVTRVDLHVHSVAASDEGPFIVADSTLARANQRAVVLQSAVNPIGIRAIQLEGVELPDSGPIHLVPCVASVIARVDSAVIAQQQSLGVIRVDPDLMMIDMNIRCLNVLEGLASVIRTDEGNTYDIDPFGIVGSHAHLAEIVSVCVGDLPNRLCVGPAPAVPRIVTTEDLKSADVGLEQIGVGIVEFI